MDKNETKDKIPKKKNVNVEIIYTKGRNIRIYVRPSSHSTVAPLKSLRIAIS